MIEHLTLPPRLCGIWENQRPYTDAWRSFRQPPLSWTDEGFGGDIVGRLCKKVNVQPENESRNQGVWPHGWQFWVSSIFESHFRRTSTLSGPTATCQAHLRSHSGRNSGAALLHAPTAPEFTIRLHLFRLLLLARLRLPLLLTEKTCNACHEPLDPLERTACFLTGDSRNEPGQSKE